MISLREVKVCWGNGANTKAPATFSRSALELFALSAFPPFSASAIKFVQLRAARAIRTFPLILVEPI